MNREAEENYVGGSGLRAISSSLEPRINLRKRKERDVKEKAMKQEKKEKEIMKKRETKESESGSDLQEEKKNRKGREEKI